MPYKDPERKKEWERLHRPQRQARRRELRQTADSQQATRPDATQINGSAAGLLIPLAAGSATPIFKKSWEWWALGVAILALGLFFYWNKQNAQGPQAEKTNETP
jgi:hypothetical protein